MKGVKDDPGDWILNGDLGHWLWKEVRNRARVYWPHDTDAFIELYIDPKFDDPVRLNRNAGVKTTDGDFVTFTGEDEDDWFDKSALGYASFTWTYKYRTIHNIDNIQFWGHVYSTLGTRYWFEFREEQEGGPVKMENLRIPVPDELEMDVREWAADHGCEWLHTKSAVFEQRFSDLGESAPDVHHNDVHIRCDRLETAEEVKEMLEGGLDFVERAARMG